MQPMPVICRRADLEASTLPRLLSAAAPESATLACCGATCVRHFVKTTLKAQLRSVACRQVMMVALDWFARKMRVL